MEEMETFEAHFDDPNSQEFVIGLRKELWVKEDMEIVVTHDENRLCVEVKGSNVSQWVVFALFENLHNSKLSIKTNRFMTFIHLIIRDSDRAIA